MNDEVFESSPCFISEGEGKGYGTDLMTQVTSDRDFLPVLGELLGEHV